MPTRGKSKIAVPKNLTGNPERQIPFVGKLVITSVVGDRDLQTPTTTVSNSNKRSYSSWTQSPEQLFSEEGSGK